MAKSHLGCAETLLNHKEVNVNFVDDHGHTLTAQAVQNLNDNNADNALTQIDFLVTRKHADVNIRDAEGRQALHLLASTFTPTLNTDYINKVPHISLFKLLCWCSSAHIFRPANKLIINKCALMNIRNMISPKSMISPLPWPLPRLCSMEELISTLSTINNAQLWATLLRDTTSRSSFSFWTILTRKLTLDSSTQLFSQWLRTNFARLDWRTRNNRFWFSRDQTVLSDWQPVLGQLASPRFRASLEKCGEALDSEGYPPLLAALKIYSAWTFNYIYSNSSTGRGQQHHVQQQQQNTQFHQAELLIEVDVRNRFRDFITTLIKCTHANVSQTVGKLKKFRPDANTATLSAVPVTPAKVRVIPGAHWAFTHSFLKKTKRPRFLNNAGYGSDDDDDNDDVMSDDNDDDDNNDDDMDQEGPATAPVDNTTLAEVPLEQQYGPHALFSVCHFLVCLNFSFPESFLTFLSKIIGLVQRRHFVWTSTWF